MKLRHVKYPALVVAAAALAGCQSSTNQGFAPSAGAPAQIPVPGISSAVTYSFDLGAIDKATGMYYVTDRTNKAVDVINIGNGGAAAFQAGGVTLFKQAFAGCNSGGTTGGQTHFPYTPMPGCLNIAITANITLVTNNDLDGPDGLDIVGPNLFVGDVNALWVINKTTGALVQKVAIANTGTQQGFRSDEGCYDPVNHLYATALTGDPNTPFMTILDTTQHDLDGTSAPVVIARLLMNDGAGNPSAGIEACFFDTRGATPNVTTAAAGYLWLNNDGSTANLAGVPPGNPNGEADGIPIGDLIAIRNTPLAGLKKIVFAGPLTATADFNAASTSPPICALGSGACGTVAPKVYGLPALCDATGIAQGPAGGNEAGAMCRPGTFGTRMDFVIFNTGGPAVTAPSTVQIVAGAGGGDQVAYDAAGGTAGRYYLANSRATPNGKTCFNNAVSGTPQVCNLTPKLTVVDAATHAVITNVDSGNNAHSVAAGLGLVLMPFTNTSATAGGANFPNGGVAIYPTF